MNWRKRSEDKALEDITNKLVSRPIKMKPAWNGPNFSNGSNVKDSVFAKRAGSDQDREEENVKDKIIFSDSPTNLRAVLDLGRILIDHLIRSHPILGRTTWKSPATSSIEMVGRIGRRLRGWKWKVGVKELKPVAAVIEPKWLDLHRLSNNNRREYNLVELSRSKEREIPQRVEGNYEKLQTDVDNFFGAKN